MPKKLLSIWKKNIVDEDELNAAVTWAYRLFLDREPENNYVVEEKRKKLLTTREIRTEFLSSEEYKSKNQPLCHLPMSGNEPPLSIEFTSDLREIFAHIKTVWEKLGKTEPYWSVLTCERFKSEDITSNQDDFYSSGKENVETFFATLLRNGIKPADYETCIEYGCGVGRITAALANKFSKVTAYDISSSHLRIAREYISQSNLKNVEFVLLSSPEDIRLPKTDVVYSVIVLQHNPPPIIQFIIRAMLRALNSGGVAFFQVPTYRLGYRFSLREYLSSDIKREDMEMHVLPQKEIFRIADEEDCRIIEVLEDGWAGIAHGERSNTFLIQKR